MPSSGNVFPTTGYSFQLESMPPVADFLSQQVDGTYATFLPGYQHQQYPRQHPMLTPLPMAAAHIDVNQHLQPTQLGPGTASTPATAQDNSEWLGHEHIDASLFYTGGSAGRALADPGYPSNATGDFISGGATPAGPVGTEEGNRTNFSPAAHIDANQTGPAEVPEKGKVLGVERRVMGREDGGEGGAEGGAEESEEVAKYGLTHKELNSMGFRILENLDEFSELFADFAANARKHKSGPTIAKMLFSWYPHHLIRAILEHGTTAGILRFNAWPEPSEATSEYGITESELNRLDHSIAMKLKAFKKLWEQMSSKSKGNKGSIEILAKSLCADVSCPLIKAIRDHADTQRTTAHLEMTAPRGRFFQMCCREKGT